MPEFSSALLPAAGNAADASMSNPALASAATYTLAEAIEAHIAGAKAFAAGAPNKSPLPDDCPLALDWCDGWLVAERHELEELMKEVGERYASA